MSSSKHVQETHRTSKRFLEKNFNGKCSLSKVAVNPFPIACDPETDVSEPLPPNEASYYNTIIGVLRWVVELGRIDVKRRSRCYRCIWLTPEKVISRLPCML